MKTEPIKLTDCRRRQRWSGKETLKSNKNTERKKHGGSSRAAHSAARCEGWRRHGGAFTLGPVTWKQCKAQGIVTLKFKDADSGEVKTLPACKECWAECLATGVTIIEARPIAPNDQVVKTTKERKSNERRTRHK